MPAKIKLPSLAVPKSATPDGQMELMEHLAELRMRIFRAILYVAVGMIITYNQFPQIMGILNRPILPVLSAVDGRFITSNVTDSFILYIQVCFISGLVVAFPFVIYELWGFIAPALTPEERKPIKFLAPFSALLFLAGVGTAYAALPATYTWMASFIASVPGASLYQTAQSYVLLTLKILLSFGIAFELPIVLLFLARIGIINANLMTTYWRHATVVIAAMAAVLTPSNDPLTMLMMAVPMAALYLLSISLVRTFEPRPDGSRSASFLTLLIVGLAPVAILCAVTFWLWRTTSGKVAHPATALRPAASAPAPGATPTLVPSAPATPAAPASPMPTEATPTTPQTAEVEALRAQVQAQETELQELKARLERIESLAAPAPQTTPDPSVPGPDPVEGAPAAEPTP